VVVEVMSCKMEREREIDLSYKINFVLLKETKLLAHLYQCPGEQ